MSRRTAIAIAIAIACGGDATEAPVVAAKVEQATTAEEIVSAELVVGDCEALAASAVRDEDDAALLPVMCPELPLDPVTARAVLMAAGSSEQARRVVPLLQGLPELQAVARLVGHVKGAMVAELVDPGSAPVTPLDDAVLAQVQLARALLHDETTHVDTRTRARAYLAKAHMGAVKQLGIGPTRPPAPFGRLLAAHAIHYGRSFCASFWQRQLPGLFDLAVQTEVDLLAATLALEASHYGADPAIVSTELGEGRRYVSRDDARARIEKRLEGSPEATTLDPDRIAPTVSDLERLLAHGFVEAAIARGLALGGTASGPGLAPLQQLLGDALARSEGDEHEAELEARFAAVRKQVPRPPEDGPGELDHAREPPWPTATAVADAMLDELRASATGFARRRALGRAVLVARRRPDALLAAIDIASRSDDRNLQSALPLLRAVADELDDGSLRFLRRSHATDADRALRQEFALGAREGGAMPR